MRAALAQLLHDCRRLQGIDLVVSGDIPTTAPSRGYTDALELVGGFAREGNAAHVRCTGNHDARDAFIAVLGSGHLSPSGQEATGDHPCLVPGGVAGRVSQLALVWRREELTSPAPAGSIVVLHHPPISWSPQQAAAGLQNPAALASALQGTDVHPVRCGQSMRSCPGTWGGATVWVGPGVVTRVDLTAPPAVVGAVRGAAASVVDLGGSSSPLVHLLHARDPRVGEQVYLADAITWQDVATEEHQPTLTSP